MSGSSVEFYADTEDLRLLFSRFKELYEYKYIQSMSALNEENIDSEDPFVLLEFLSTQESPNQTHVFLCTDSSTIINTMPIKMKSENGVKKRVDQVFNPDSSEILLGGQIDDSLIVTTTIRTTGETASAKQIFKNLKKTLLKHSKKVNSFYVMPSAYQKFENGVRLAQGINFNSEFDLQLD